MPLRGPGARRLLRVAGELAIGLTDPARWAPSLPAGRTVRGDCGVAGEGYGTGESARIITRRLRGRVLPAA